jgi:hypothetical protein
VHGHTVVGLQPPSMAQKYRTTIGAWALGESGDRGHIGRDMKPYFMAREGLFLQMVLNSWQEKGCLLAI